MRSTRHCPLCFLLCISSPSPASCKSNRCGRCLRWEMASLIMFPFLDWSSTAPTHLSASASAFVSLCICACRCVPLRQPLCLCLSLPPAHARSLRRCLCVRARVCASTSNLATGAPLTLRGDCSELVPVAHMLHGHRLSVPCSSSSPTAQYKGLFGNLKYVGGELQVNSCPGLKTLGTAFPVLEEIGGQRTMPRHPCSSPPTDPRLRDALAGFHVRVNLRGLAWRTPPRAVALLEKMAFADTWRCICWPRQGSSKWRTTTTWKLRRTRSQNWSVAFLFLLVFDFSLELPPPLPPSPSLSPSPPLPLPLFSPALVFYLEGRGCRL